MNTNIRDHDAMRFWRDRFAAFESHALAGKQLSVPDVVLCATDYADATTEEFAIRFCEDSALDDITTNKARRAAGNTP